ncbi:hypothetical protein [Massilia sp. GCM10023247]|uniref:hypothetical protein n=1 Tax=Massilia sp. GCM10023247 TaxID=3252643 RepID=UPI003621CC86
MNEIKNNGCIGHPVTNLLIEAEKERAAERQAKAKPKAPAAPAATKPARKKPAAKAK